MSLVKFELIKHNSNDQRDWKQFDDTRKYLHVGQVYDAKVEAHSFYTRLHINGRQFNSVCFEEAERTPVKMRR